MDQYIAVAPIADEEAEPASRIEPLDSPRDSKAVAIVVRTIVVRTIVVIAFGHVVLGIMVALAEDRVRDKGFGVSRRTSG